MSSMRDVHLALAWFGKHDVLGIPADFLAHFVVGFIVCWFVAQKFKSQWVGYGVVFGLELFKELFIDLSATLYSREFIHPIIGVFVTLSGAWLGVFFLRLRGKI